MSDKTGIEWCDSTWNPIRGCSRVSEGCRHCYAETVAARFSGKGLPYEGLTRDGKWNGQIKFVPEHLSDPIKWKRPRRIFVNSMSDLFHENVTDEWIDQIFAVMALCPQHTFQVLTKRPARMREYLSESTRESGRWDQMLYDGRFPWPDAWVNEIPEARMKEAYDFICENVILPNVCLGVSVEDQATYDARWPDLAATPAAVRFLSYEPALGPIDFKLSCAWDPVRGEKQAGPPTYRFGPWRQFYLHWIICGGESGLGARPMHPDWARSVRDQCEATRRGHGEHEEKVVKFFFKQWGEFAAGCQLPEATREMKFEGSVMMNCLGETSKRAEEIDGNVRLYRVGKKAAGRHLDGRTWDEMPEANNERLG